MRVSQVYGLSGNQGTFEFIDVDVEKDIPLFIDPAAIASIRSPWTDSCTSAIQGFFQAVLDKIVAGDEAGGRALLSHLTEENATHLGYSSRSRGSGVGVGLAARFYEELSTSAAVRSGFVKDLEDTALLIEGVSEDRISDVTTNIIRRQLIEFTQRAADFHGIPLAHGVAVGPHWDAAKKLWTQDTASLPLTEHGPLILVPKAIVRRTLFFNSHEYYRHFVLEYFRYQELNNANSPLVYVLKSGERRVLKSDVEKKVRAANDDGTRGIEKRVNVDGTKRDPTIFDDYKRAKSEHPPRPAPHDVIADATTSEPPDFKSLLDAVLEIPAGREAATRYERAVEALLSALFYPSLVNPIRQENIHAGRKRIDLSFTNAAQDQDFFYWLALHYPAANVVAECKNYNEPLANPEFDQLAGRFSPSRGRYGLLVHRKYEEKERLIASCVDTAHDDRGFITPLDDEDLASLVEEMLASGSCTAFGGLLHNRFKRLIE